MPQVLARTATKIASEEAACNGFQSRGVIGPVALFTPAECRAVLAHEASPNRPNPRDWMKDRAAIDPFYHNLARDERLLAWLRPLLGRDIILWGVDVPRREPGQIHPWHCDIESSAPEGRFVSIWIGLENTSRESALIGIVGSHLFGRSIQEEAARWGLKRGQATHDLVLSWARGHNHRAYPMRPDMQDGEALIFDGRLWHGTHNTRAHGTRSALLLQYAAADNAVRMIDTAHLEWPFRFREDMRPPVIAVSGSADEAVNRVVPPPLPDQGEAPIDTAVKPIGLPLPEGGSAPWQPFPQFRGPTRSLALMGCHVSVLVPGHSPHKPHAHAEEELLIVLDGEADIVIARSPDDEAPRRETLARGQFSYYPAFQHHTICNASAAPATYLMLKWLGGEHGAAPSLAAGTHDARALMTRDDERDFAPSLVFEGATGYLKTLHCHLTRLKPGAGYAPHVDAYDVAVVVLDGTVETMGATIGGSGVAYFSSGIAHGMRNPGATTATYLVFEFHAA